jgi:uncharacterized cupredoxin-like copper-binding protein
VGVHPEVDELEADAACPIRFKQLGPRQHADRTLKLKPGRYLLWCSIAGHRQKGMHATFLVPR